MRCVHEASLYDENAFVTLTYDQSHMPERGQLEYHDFQLFMKRLRKIREARFYMCGEYGPQLMRPHFHAILFGIDFADKYYWTTGESGEDSYRSDTLERIWGKGFATTGDVNFRTAGYVARYCMKKITGKESENYYKRKDERGEYRLQPEFNRMSLKPGIGKRFLEKWETDIYPRDYVVVNSTKTKPPKYYDKIYEKNKPEMFEQMKYQREKKGRLNYLDNTDRRLIDKEIVQEARIQTLKRNL